MHQVGVVEGRRGGAIGEGEGIAGGPGLLRHLAVGDAIGGVEQRPGFRHAVRVAPLGRAQPVADDLLQRDLDVVVVEAVPEARLQGEAGICGDKRRRAGMTLRQATGRASCREEVCTYVAISVVAVALKQTDNQRPSTIMSTHYSKK